MPSWGLTREQTLSRPWGLKPECLRPDKTITDPVHGDIFLNRLEMRLVDSRPMQRLRYVSQLGTTHLVYPGATHSRLSHALGALRSAQDLLDAVINNRTQPTPIKDLFEEWNRTPDITVRDDSGDEFTISQFDQRLAEVTVLVRIGALLHDLCHVSIGHTVEDELEIFEPHDSGIRRFRKLWGALPPDLLDEFDEASLSFRLQLLGLILSKNKKVRPTSVDDEEGVGQEFTYPFAADIVGNTICADLIDYLERDHLYTGLPMALGHRFISQFYVAPSRSPYYPEKMVIRVAKHGHERADIVSELLKYLRYRYELTERVLNHHAKVAADAMFGNLIQIWYETEWVSAARDRLGLSAGEGPTEIDALRQALDDTAESVDAPSKQTTGMSTLHAVPKGKKRPSKEVDDGTTRALERQFLKSGDEALLSYLIRWSKKHPEVPGASKLAVGLRDRQLFKLIGRVDGKAERGIAATIFKKFGGRAQRGDLEREVARYVGVPETWKLAIWLPAPRMKLKVAGVLVDQGSGVISPLDRAGNSRATEIYDSHENLWEIRVYAHPVIDADVLLSQKILSALGDQMGVQVKDRKGVPVPPSLDIAVRLVAEHRWKSDERFNELKQKALQAKLASHSPDSSQTFKALQAQILTLANKLAKADDLMKPT
jgi:HD superfamily phosphohydrolase